MNSSISSVSAVVLENLSDCLFPAFPQVRAAIGFRKISLSKPVLLMAAMMVFIVSVSMYDLYWSFKTQATLLQEEQNPIGVWLIHLDGGDIALFMTCKTVGNLLVAAVLVALFGYRKEWGLAVAAGLTSFQLMLAIYLNFGHLL